MVPPQNRSPRTISSYRHLHKIDKNTMGYSWGGIMQAFPWVTHGNDLCKTYHGLLTERIYAGIFCIISLCVSRALSWHGFMQKLKRGSSCNILLFCINPSQISILASIFTRKDICTTINGDEPGICNLIDHEYY